MAQSPNMINYQGVARNTNGSAIANQNIKVRLKVRQGTATGTVKYSEVRSLTTDASGLFTIQIGSAGATSTTGSWGAIKWESGAKFLQVEMDATGGNNFIDMGTQQLLSVPYAQYANNAASISLPYSATDSLTTAMFDLTNNNRVAIHASSVNAQGVFGESYFNNGVNGSSGSPNYSGVLGTNNGGGTGVMGFSNSGYGVSGSSPNNTGVFGTSNNSNGVYGNSNGNNAGGVVGYNSSNSGTGVSGIAAINGVGVKGSSGTGFGVLGSTSSILQTGAGIKGENKGTAGSGVLGVANIVGGYGVQGSSTVGTGVLGFSNNNVGVYGYTTGGTALKGHSTNGYGLDIEGKVKIAGANTNPGEGKILTSDATGNAVWKTDKVGFAVRGIAPGGYANLANTNFNKIHFKAEDFDWGDNYKLTSQVPSSTFIAPVSGLYHFDADITIAGFSIWQGILSEELIGSSLGIWVIDNNNVSAPYQFSTNSNDDDDRQYDHHQLSVNIYLQAGNQVYLTALGRTDNATNPYLQSSESEAAFSGYLIKAE